jgi:hypothetical protein
MAKSKKNIVAVNGDTDQAGAIVYWTLSSAVLHDELVKAWTDAGFKEADVVEPPNPQTACLRAVNEERSERSRRLRRPLEGYKGHALVDEDAKDRDLDYAVRCKAEVDAVGRIQIETDDDELKERIEKAYHRHLFNELSTSDISGWVVGALLPQVDAVALRPTGGFYFVPRQHLASWRRMVGALRECSNHGFFEVPAMHTEEAIDAILASVTSEARTLAEGMWNDIAEGKIGGRALETRASKADDMHSKVERYEKLLGLALPDLQDSLTKLKANLSAAALKAHEDEDYTNLADLADL